MSDEYHKVIFGIEPGMILYNYNARYWAKIIYNEENIFILGKNKSED